MTEDKKKVSGGDEDALLMVQFQRGNNEAFNSLVVKYQQMVVGVIARYTGDRANSEDMTQEVFIRVYRNRGNYQPTVPFRYYLFTIVHNLCLNEIRDSGRHKTTSIDFDDTFKTPATEEDSHKRELQDAVKAAIEALPPQQRMAVILDKYQELSYEEIAKTMRLSLTATKSVIWRARQNLKEQLKKYIS